MTIFLFSSFFLFLCCALDHILLALLSHHTSFRAAVPFPVSASRRKVCAGLSACGNLAAINRPYVCFSKMTYRHRHGRAPSFSAYRRGVPHASLLSSAQHGVLSISNISPSLLNPLKTTLPSSACTTFEYYSPLISPLSPPNSLRLPKKGTKRTHFFISIY